jgi:hypothetical protein
MRYDYVFSIGSDCLFTNFHKNIFDFFDLNKNMTFEEGLRKYVENSSKLSNFGSLEGVMAFFFGSDNEKDYEKYDRNWSYLSDIRNQMLGFDNGGAVQMFVRNIDIINK